MNIHTVCRLVSWKSKSNGQQSSHKNNQHCLENGRQCKFACIELVAWWMGLFYLLSATKTTMTTMCYAMLSSGWGGGGAFRMDDGLFINYKLNWAHVFQYLSMSLFGEWWGWCSVDEFINTVAFWTILRHKMHWPAHFINKNWPNLTPFMCAYLPFSAG